ncbi:retrotransposon protein, putative, ty1-copia subclass [Tanacetum coccineum]
MIGLTEWLEIHAPATKQTRTHNTQVADRKRKRTRDIIKQVFFNEEVVVDGMERNLAPPLCVTTRNHRQVLETGGGTTVVLEDSSGGVIKRNASTGGICSNSHEQGSVWATRIATTKGFGVQFSLKSSQVEQEIKERSKAKGDDGEGLYVRGRTDRRDSHQSRGKSRSKSRGGRLKCYICQSEDHLKRNCPKNNRKKSTGYVKKDDQPNSSGSTYDDSEVMMVMSTQAQALLDLIMDSGCSYHMTPRFIPEIERYMISLGTLEKGGFTVKMQSGKIKVINGSRVVLSGIRRDNCVYSLDGHAMASELNASVVPYRKDVLAHGELVSSIFDENCSSGNSSIESDFGVRKAPLRREVLICSFKLMGSVSGGIIRMQEKLRRHNGLEFCNREFEQLCIESGIARHLTVVGTPQQNRVAERMNKTLMDKVRCLLIQSGLPKTFWAEATCTAAYLINRSPSRAIEKKTPMEMWSGHPSDYGMLRIFGCGVKGYRLYRLDDESPKIVTSRNVVFNESVMYKDTLKDSGAGDKSVEELQVEVETAGRDCKGVQKARYKARLVARGFTQRAGIDYNEVFSPVVRHTSIRVILALTACKDYELEQFDVKMAFLHRNLEEVIYMRKARDNEQGTRIRLWEIGSDAIGWVIQLSVEGLSVRDLMLKG